MPGNTSPKQVLTSFLGPLTAIGVCSSMSGVLYAPFCLKSDSDSKATPLCIPAVRLVNFSGSHHTHTTVSGYPGVCRDGHNIDIQVEVMQKSRAGEDRRACTALVFGCGTKQSLSSVWMRGVEENNIAPGRRRSHLIRHSHYCKDKRLLGLYIDASCLHATLSQLPSHKHSSYTMKHNRLPHLHTFQQQHVRRCTLVENTPKHL